MTKKKGLYLAVLFCVFSMAFTGCSDKKDNEKEGLFSGSGEMKNAERLNALNAIYNDDNKYFDSESEIYYKLDKKGVLTVNCKDASCTHGDDSCEAYVELGEYFVFNKKVYKAYNKQSYADGAVIYKGYIEDISGGKTVFDNPVPDEMSEEQAMDDSTEIYYVRVLNDELLKVEGHIHAYILDKDFNIKYWYGDVGKFPWGMIYNDNYYYVNDLYQMVKVDLKTNKSETLDLAGKVFGTDNDDEYIYYSDEFGDLYKYSLSDESAVKIAEDSLLFSVHGKYIYSEGTDKKIIYDKDGKLVADYTDYENMGADSILKIGDKMYTSFNGGVAEMSADGKDYKEYMLE